MSVGRWRSMMVKTVEKYFYLQETVTLLFQGYGNLEH